MRQFKVLFLLLLSVLIFSCSSNPEKPGNRNGNSAPANTSHSITGTWTIKKYFFSEISAMDETMASEWLDKKLVIDSQTHFSFQAIKSYKDIFKNSEACSITNLNQPDTAQAISYFTRRAPLSEMNVASQQLLVYKTSCKDNPFSEFVLTENRELIIHWDGAYFILTKE